jgi:hypothetical protein
MRFLGVALAICSLSAALFASPSDDVWRPPQPVPRECATIQIEAVLLDVSRSMRHGGLFDHQRKSIEDYLTNTAQSCSLVIVGSFGITADVQDAQFLTTTAGRARLVGALQRLRPEHPSTNLEEAAKLVELLSYQLRAVYGAQANRLVVRVYSDYESSPSIGKPGFSLAEYLARRMNGRYIRDSASDGTLKEVVQVLATPLLEVKPAVKPQEPLWGKKAILAAAIVGFVLIIALCCMLLVRSRPGHCVDRGSGPVALLVTECVAQGDQVSLEMRSPERRVEVATGVPVVFSTNADLATYVAAVVPAADSGELFRIEPLLDGSVRIQSPYSRLTVNEDPLDFDRTLNINMREPIRIRLGPREFTIVGVFGRAGVREPHEEIFDAEPLQH